VGGDVNSDPTPLARGWGSHLLGGAIACERSNPKDNRGGKQKVGAVLALGAGERRLGGEVKNGKAAQVINLQGRHLSQKEGKDLVRGTDAV